MKTRAEKIFADDVKHVQRKWGHGWNRLGSSLQQALVRAEVMTTIAGVDTDGAAPGAAESYRKHIDELVTLAMRWEPEY